VVFMCTGAVHHVREGIVFPPAVLKFVNFYLCKKSLAGNNLIALKLLVNFKNRPQKFFSKCTYIWFRRNKMGYGIGMHK